MEKLVSRRTESMLLTAMMEQRRIMEIALPRLSNQMFGSDETREIFDRVLTLIGQGKSIPGPRVMAHDPGLSKPARLQIMAEVRNRARQLKSFSRDDAYAALDTLNYYRKVRVIYESVKRTTKTLDNPRKIDIDKLQADIQSDLSELAEEGQSGTTLHIGRGGNISDKMLTDKLRRALGDILPTGFREIDRQIKGWRRGNVVLITAFRGEGKSLLAKTLSVNHFRDKKNVCIINLEMTDDEYLWRLFAQETPFKHETLRRGLYDRKSIQKILAARRKLDSFGQVEGCRWTLRTITNPLYNERTMHAELKYQGYDVVIIDYINLLASGGAQDLWLQIHNAAQYIKMMAKDLNCLVYLLAQLNEEGRAKYGRSLEEACDVWIHWKLDRDKMFHKGHKKGEKTRVEDLPTTRFKHGKARDYEPFEWELAFDGQNSQFRDIESDLEEEDNSEKPVRRRKKSKLKREVQKAERRGRKKHKTKNGKEDEPRRRKAKKRAPRRLRKPVEDTVLDEDTDSTWTPPNKRGRRKLPELTE